VAALAGERVRRLRIAAGKGLRDQARDIGISASSLSALENNRGGISLQRLQRIAAYFGVPITDLLDGGGEPRGTDGERVEVTHTQQLRRGVRRGTGASYHLLGHGHGHTLQPYLISLEPGGGYAGDAIAHLGEEFAYVIFGAVELLLDREAVALRQGDAVRFRTETPHALRNASETAPAIVIGAATPPW